MMHPTAVYIRRILTSSLRRMRIYVGNGVRRGMFGGAVFAHKSAKKAKTDTPATVVFVGFHNYWDTLVLNMSHLVRR